MSSPFDREHADAWASDFVDVESLNARTTETILRSIDAIRDTSRRDPDDLRSRSVLVLGPAGAGKTHLFARLRKKCGPRAAFVLMRPEISSDPTPRHVLAACVDALQRRPMGGDERQLDIVILSALALLEGQGVKWPNAFLDELRSAPKDEREELLSRAVEGIADRYPEVNLPWLEKFLALPVAAAPDRRAALTWLSGREPDSTQLERLGLQEPLPDTSVLPALRTLAIIAAYSTPIVVVFDQLENLIDDEGGAGRIHAHARLIAELFDSVRGLVLVQMALDAEWVQRIRPAFSASERSRLEAHVEALELPTPAARAALVEAWIGRLPPDERRGAPWPFSTTEWQSWMNAPGVTPRMLMIACREASRRPEGAIDEVAACLPGSAQEKETPDEREDRLREIWEERRALTRTDLAAAQDDGRPIDAERLASGLGAALKLVHGVRVEPKRTRQPQDLRIMGAGRDTDVFVIQHGHPRSACAALQRAKSAAGDRAVLALRESARPFPPTWHRAGELLKELSSQSNATWSEVQPAEVVDLLAVHDLLSLARSQDLTGRDGAPLPEELVHLWAKSSLEIEAWPTIAAAISRASVVSEAPVRTSSPPSPSPPEERRPSTPPSSPRLKEGSGAAEKKLEAGLSATVLMKLRLASVDRVVRETRVQDPKATRASVLKDLRALGQRIRWLGRAIVVWNGGSR
jgi:hypothetical protein